MKSYAILSALIITVLFVGADFSKNYANADQAQMPDGYVQADIKEGALLYDNWQKISGTKLEGNHPLYPAEGKKSGKSTWRCKECHGWDYIGSRGRYSKGSHYTGIAGVDHVQEESPVALYNSLADKKGKHDFSEFISVTQIWNLVKFLREGLAPIEPVIDSQGLAKGDSARGKVLYETNCSDCHGADGNGIDFKGKKEGVQGVGWLANDNPQESIHKIRWGHPGSDMPSMIADKNLSEQDSIDILTYSQSLKQK